MIPALVFLKIQLSDAWLPTLALLIVPLCQAVTLAPTLLDVAGVPPLKLVCPLKEEFPLVPISSELALNALNEITVTLASMKTAALGVKILLLANPNGLDLNASKLTAVFPIVKLFPIAKPAML